MHDRIKKKRQAHNESSRKVSAEKRQKSNILYNIYTGKKAPKGASKSNENITFRAYTQRHVSAAHIIKTTYVNAKTGEPAPGITKETHKPQQHTTLYIRRVHEKHKEFSKILDEGGDLPPVPLAKVREKSNKLYDIDTGKKAPEGASKSAQYVPFPAFVRRHVEHSQINKTTYVNASTGEPADGITKETHHPREHITRYSWLVRQKYAEFSKTLKEGNDLPPPPLRSKNNRQKAQAADKRQATLAPALSSLAPPIAEASSTSTDHHSPLTTSGPGIDLINTGKQLPLPPGTTEEELILNLDFLDSETPSSSPDTTPSAASSVSVPILPPANHPSPTLDAPLSLNPTGAFAASASRIADPSEQTLAQKRIQKRQARSKTQRKARAGQWGKSKKLFDIGTGKQAPEGASKSEQYVTFHAFVQRHVKNSILNRTTYVDAISGEPADDVTEKTQDPREPITRYSWLVRQKYEEFSKILEADRDSPLPPPPLSDRDKQQKRQAANKRKATLAPALSTLAPPIADTSSTSADHHSPLTTSGAGIDSINTGKQPLLPLGATKSAAPSSSPDTIPSATSSVSAPLVPPASHPLPTPSDTPLNSNPEETFDASSDPISSWISSSTDQARPLPSPGLETIVDDPLLAENPISDPVVSAAQDSFAQDTSRKRKPNVHSFFHPKGNDRAGPASRKAKTMLSDGSVEHPLPEADKSDSTSGVSCTPSLAAKKPTF